MERQKNNDLFYMRYLRANAVNKDSNELMDNVIEKRKRIGADVPGMKNIRMGRKQSLKVRYNLTEEQVIEMHNKQEGLCAICGSTISKCNQHIDHDHKTGKIRGLLCSRCNHAIGYFNDNPEYMEAGAKYIRNNLAISIENNENSIVQTTNL